MAMPKILARLVRQLVKNGKSKATALAIATRALQKSGNLQRGTGKATAKGIKRGNMTPGERAIDRAKKRRPGQYKYNPVNNTAVKGEINKDVNPRA